MYKADPDYEREDEQDLDPPSSAALGPDPGSAGGADLERDRIDLVAEEFAEHCRRGHAPSVSEYAARYPELAEEIRTILPTVALMEQLKRQRRRLGASDSEEARAAAAPPLERLGDMRILREIGRGGMGIVYEAVQESLGRRVALKVLPRHSFLDSRMLQRFRREAQAVAQLHHPHIVPVFGVGEQDGLHYYVMQLISGRGLHSVIRALRRGTPVAKVVEQPQTFPSAEWEILGKPVAAASPAEEQPQGEFELELETSEGSPGPAAENLTPLDDNYWRFAARVGLQVAEALEYAHGQGVLHRDIKPANLLLDERGNLWVTDFGLAKLGAQGDITATGDIIGTLQYMAPEGLQGQSDARSDVYGLGMTLYELLTLTPPYDESNPSRLIRRVSQDQPLRPRKRNPAIPRDLETIVLKATARDPADRYPTAAALGEDLTRFLGDRPVRARRATVAEHFGRWCRRNKPLAALGATALGSLLFAAVVGWVGLAMTRKALEGESARRREADAATRRAEANVSLSLAALEEIFNSLTLSTTNPPFDFDDRRGRHGPPLEPPPGPPPGPPPYRGGSEEGQTALLQSILQFYDRFAALNATNATLKREAAKAHRRIGEIRQRLGQADAAEAAFNRAVALFEALSTDVSGDPDDRHALAETLIVQEPRSEAPRALETAIARWQRARSIEETLRSEFPGNLIYASALATIDGKLGSLLEKLGRAAEAETSLRRAVALREALAEESPEDAYSAILLAAASTALGKLLHAQNASAEARTSLDASAVELHTAMAHPLSPGTARMLAQQLEDLALVYRNLGETARGDELTAEARTFRESRAGGHRYGPGPGAGPGGPGGGSGPPSHGHHGGPGPGPHGGDRPPPPSSKLRDDHGKPPPPPHDHGMRGYEPGE